MSDESGVTVRDGMERRSLSFREAEMRVEERDEGPGTLEGYGAVVGSRSVPLPGPDGRQFTEVIRPGAFDAVMDQEGRDVVSARNHDLDNVLGRESNSTLRLEVDGRGLRYSVDLPDTSVGRDTAELVRRGDITGSSFTFSVPEDGQEWREEDGELVREITEFSEIGDVGPVLRPAYRETVVDARSLEKAGITDLPESRQKRPTFEGTEDTEPAWADGAWDRPALSDHPEGGESWEELGADARSAIAGRFIVGTADADSYGELGYPVVNPATDNLNRNGLLAARQRASAEDDAEVESIADALWEEFYADDEDANRGDAMCGVCGAEMEARGEVLGALLTDLVDEMAEAEDMDVEDVHAGAGDAAGIDASTVGQIKAGEINCPPLGRLEGFAEFFGASVDSLVSAAEEDGCDYSDDERSALALTEHRRRRVEHYRRKIGAQS